MVLMSAVAGYVALTHYVGDKRQRTIEFAQSVIANDPRHAELLLRELLDEQPNGDSRVLALLTESLARQQRLDEALETARQWTQQVPEDAAAWTALAQLEEAQARIVPAIAALRKAVRFAEPLERSALRHDLIRLLIQAEDPAGARHEVQQLEAEGAEPPSLIQQAYLLRLEGQPSEALSRVNQAISQQPSSTAALMLRGVIQLDLGRHEQAAADLSRIVQRDPANKEAHYKLGIALRGIGDHERAERHLEISRRLVQHSNELLSLQAQISADPENAALHERLRSALQSPPTNAMD